MAAPAGLNTGLQTGQRARDVQAGTPWDLLTENRAAFSKRKPELKLEN